MYGVDWNGPMPEDLGDDAESVAVPESLIEISDECREDLTTQVPPLTDSTNYGVDLYLAALEFIQQEMSL